MDNSRRLKPLVIAHRGASGLAPENTMAAFKLAVALGTDGVEMDVQLAADGQPVVIHDARVDRTTNGAGAVAALSSDQLAKLDAGRWFDRRLVVRPRARARVESLQKLLGHGSSGFAGEPVPTLDATLRFLQSTGLRRVYIELKGTRATRPELLRVTVELVKRLRMDGVVTLLSFDHKLLKESKRIAQQIRVAPIFPLGAGPRVIRSAAMALDAEEAALHFSLATRRGVADLHARGIKVSCWTVNRKMLMRRLVKAGVDSIMTNFPDRLMDMLESRSDMRQR